MSQIPTWWLVLSTIIFVANAILILALAVAVFKVAALVQDLKPKIEGLVTKVDGITTRVDGLTASLQSTVQRVGQRAEGVSGAASSMAMTTSRVFEKYAPFLGIAIAGFKLFTSFQEYRAGHEKSDGKVQRSKSVEKVNVA